MEECEKIKNWNKLRSDADRDSVRLWSKITTVTINDEGFFMMDLIPRPATPNAHMFKEK